MSRFNFILLPCQKSGDVTKLDPRVSYHKQDLTVDAVFGSPSLDFSSDDEEGGQRPRVDSPFSGRGLLGISDQFGGGGGFGFVRDILPLGLIKLAMLDLPTFSEDGLDEWFRFGTANGFHVLRVPLDTFASA